ncbi:MAG: hypothetical protein KC609_06285 [Myxococcales bacterium]|nr:hypothetical protein [Myxococcales bacterium]
MLASAGRPVDIVQDYFYGMLLPGGKLVQYGRKPAWAVPGRDALVFFRDGKKLASYPLEGLLKRTRLVDLSSSHIDWIANWETFRRPLKRTLELVTTSFRRYRFDTTSGKQLSRGDTKAWTDCPFIAYGKVWHSKHGWEMSPAYSVKGNTPSRVWPLETRLPKPLTRSHQTLCLSKARGIWTATRVLRTLNGASLRR